MISDIVLRTLAGQAASLHERLHGKVRATLPAPSQSQIAKLRDVWCEAVSYTGDSGLRQRVELAGLTLEAATALLGDVIWREDQPLPEWVFIYESYQACLRDLDVAQLVSAWSFSGEEPAPFPFQEILRPLGDIAITRLQRASGAAFSMLSPNAIRGALEDLLRRLMTVARSALTSLYHQHAGRLAFAGAAALAEEAWRQPIQFSRRVLDELGPQELLRKLQRYPVCLRRLCVTAQQWADSLAEFLLRAHQDLLGFKEHFAAVPRGSIQRIIAASSDPHRCGRQILFVEWSEGPRLVYKPSSQGNAALYFAFTAHLNRLGAPELLAEVAIWDRGDYGWMEYVAARALENDQDTEAYLRQFGATLACVHALVGEDFHRENLIFDGHRLVPVDHEVLFSPSLQGTGSCSDVPAGMQSTVRAARESVLTTAMLPTFRIDRGENQPHVTGGFELLDGSRTLDVRSAIATVRRTFEATYRHILRHRELLAPWIEDALSRLGVVARCVLRDTYVYGMLAMESRGIERERHPVLRSLVFEGLWRALLNVPYRAENLDRLVFSEIEQLEKGDIPIFVCQARSRDITDADGTSIGLQAASSGHERWRRRFAEMGEERLAFQLLVLERALNLAFESAAPRQDKQEAAVLFSPPAETGDAFEGAALAIARRLCEGAVEGGDTATWIGPFALPGTMDKFYLEVLGADMHSGLEGIAVFLQALVAKCPWLGEDPTVGIIARAACAAVRDMAVCDGERTKYAPWTLGLGGGLGGRIYGLSLLAELSGDASYDELALGLARLINNTCFLQEPYHDVMRGAAGGILGLLAAHERAPNDVFVDRAIRCAEHLLQCRIRTPRGYLGWDTGQAVTTGFGHGAAGFALAFARLAAACGDERFAAIARESLQLEDSHYLPLHRAWADPRGSDKEPCEICGWCAGAPGILLARLEIERVLPGILDSAVAEAATEEILQLGTHPPDHACCGVASRAEALLELGAYFHRPEWIAQAQRLLFSIADQARRGGGYRLFRTLPREVPNWGFFQGLAGIGYTFLRALYRDTLPSVLSHAIKARACVRDA